MSFYTDSDNIKEALGKAATFCGLLFCMMLPFYIFFGFNIVLVFSTTCGYFIFDVGMMLIKKRKQRKASELSWRRLTLVPVMAGLGNRHYNCSTPEITFHYQE